MEQTQKSSSSGRSTTRRNLFGSLINFSISQGVKVNGSSTGASPTIQQTTISSCSSSPSSSNTSATKHEISSSEVFKRNKRRDELLVSASNLPEMAGSSIRSKLKGQAPKTFSVLTALNQLEISKERRGHLRSSVSTGTLTSTGSSSASSLTLPAKRSENHLSNHESLSGIRNDDLINRRTHAHARSLSPGKITPTPTQSQLRKTTNRRAVGSKERTPDWIWKIFQLAKHGRLDELKASLVGLDPTLIRHLADAKGNTLLHTAGRGGHLLTLQWLVSILGSQTEAALNDQNRTGRTVILTTLKSGQLECFQWMVLHTSFGDKALVPTEGKWSLLHFASKYGNEGAVRWLCEQLAERQVRVDLRGPGGLTALHMAAKAGHIDVSQELIRAGGDPLCQTELGWRPSDLALRHRHSKCANYFIMAEAAGSLGKELYSILMDFTTLQKQQETLRTHFREVLRVSKLLIKERGDLIKRFGPNFGSNSSSCSPPPGAALLLGGPMNGVRLSELEHSLVLAEQGWKKIECNRIDDPTDFPSSGRVSDSPAQTMNTNITTTDLLQSRLVACYARQDKNLGAGVGGMMSGNGSSCSEDESSLSTVTSGDEEVGASTDRRLKSCLRNRGKEERQEQQQPPGLISTSSPILRSTNTPWLLESDDSILSALSSPSRNNNHTSTTSQHLPNVDLLRGATLSTSASNTILLSRAGPSGTNFSSTENSPSVLRSKVYSNAESPQPSSPVVPSAAVLEVIEPPLHSTPKLYGGQSSPINKTILRRASLLQSTSCSGRSISPSTVDITMNSRIETELHFTSRTRRRSTTKPQSHYESESHLSSAHSSPLQKKEFEEIYLAPDLLHGTQHQVSGRNVVPVIGRVISSLLGTPTREKTNSSGGGPTTTKADEIYFDSDFEGNHFATFHSRKSHSTDGSLAVGPKGGNFTSRSHISSTLSGPTTTTMSTTVVSDSNLVSSSEPIIPPSTTVAHEFFLDMEKISAEQANITYVTRNAYGGSLTILPLESSTNNPQQLQLEPTQSNSSNHEIGSTTVHSKVHLLNDSSSSSTTPILQVSHSSMSNPTSTVVFPYGKPGWEPSESTTYASNLDESRVSPTPSETSKTESAVAPPHSHTSEASKTESVFGETRSSRLEEEKEEGKRESVEEENAMARFDRVVSKSQDGDNDKSCLGSNIQTTPCLTTTTQMTAALYKTSIHHRVKKSSRGRTVAKPWYEIEGSDDEGSLLRVAARRTRSRSTCHSTSSLSAPDESGSDGEMMSFCDDGHHGPHECDSTNCSRNNCPDFV